MSLRRTPAPDIAACVLLLFAATLFFAVLRALYSTAAVSAALGRAAVYGGLLAVCAGTAVGILRRRPWALPAGVVLLLLGLGAALVSFHVPDTAELPAGLLGVLGSALLLGGRREFSVEQDA